MCVYEANRRFMSSKYAIMWPEVLSLRIQEHKTLGTARFWWRGSLLRGGAHTGARGWTWGKGKGEGGGEHKKYLLHLKNGGKGKELYQCSPHSTSLSDGTMMLLK